MRKHSLQVAIPWSLSHYIPLNGFHPLYRALFDHAPDEIEFEAWDNVKLYRQCRSDATLRESVISLAKEKAGQIAQLPRHSIAARYQEYWWPPNEVLTSELPGDLEFHHTAPFPSLRRPFILHCEMFAPMFFPFAHQGTGGLGSVSELREHYRNILGHPLCLGIWSHIPETLQSIRQFFSDPIIERKLYVSRIGLSAKALPHEKSLMKPCLSRPRFLFINSAHQNPVNFFRRGGHIVLRFWKKFLEDGQEGLLMMRCARPSDADLLKHGVDPSMLRTELGRSIIWAQDYLANHELNALMASAHFLLLPSVSLHSVSIMQAMLLGAIPVVTDTVGTELYVSDRETGIVLSGIRDAFWHHDPTTGILVDSYSIIDAVDDSLVSQLAARVSALLELPDAIRIMGGRAAAYGQEMFSGPAFSAHFWNGVASAYQDGGEGGGSWRPVVSQAVQGCMVQCHESQWARIFESPTHPMLRINTGQGVVVEWGGAMMHAYGNSGLELNEWSVVAQYYKPGAPQTTFAYTLEELEGKYLHPAGFFGAGSRSKLSMKISRFLERANLILIERIARVLKPFPQLYGLASRGLSKLRRGRQWVVSRLLRHRMDADIELIWQGVSGYNVIRCVDRYYAILECEGAFIPHKAESGGYSSCFSDYSAEKVLQLIAENAVLRTQSAPTLGALADVELVLEGYHGFNIIRLGDKYHAILQSEGAFVPEKLQGGHYSRSFSGCSIKDVQRVIVAALESDREGADAQAGLIKSPK